MAERQKITNFVSPDLSFKVEYTPKPVFGPGPRCGMGTHSEPTPPSRMRRRCHGWKGAPHSITPLYRAPLSREKSPKIISVFFNFQAKSFNQIRPTVRLITFDKNGSYY